MLDRRAGKVDRRSFACFAAAALLIGCQQSDYANRRLYERNRNMAWTVDQYLDSEASRPRKLNETIELFGDVIEEDAHKLDRSARWIGKIFESDARRFDERQPIYRRVILDILDGKPETLEHTAIDLFY